MGFFICVPASMFSPSDTNITGFRMTRKSAESILIIYHEGRSVVRRMLLHASNVGRIVQPGTIFRLPLQHGISCDSHRKREQVTCVRSGVVQELSVFREISLFRCMKAG